MPLFGGLVEICEERLEALAQRLAATPLEAPSWREPVYPQQDDERFVQFLGVGNAINFCFSDLLTGEKFSVRYPYDAEKSWSGSFGMWASLWRACDEGLDVLDASLLRELSMLDAEHIFRSDGAPLPMLSERLMNLQSVGACLYRYADQFLYFFEDYHWDAGVIVDRLIKEFPAYGCDRWLHPQDGHRFSFDKRARLFVLMYEGRARSSEGRLPMLSNIKMVGPVVDYVLPKTLRYTGVLSYHDRLARLVDSGGIIVAGSEEELAIRLATHVAVEELLAEVNRHRRPAISMAELDFALWSEGRRVEGRHHLTPTTAY